MKAELSVAAEETSQALEFTRELALSAGDLGRGVAEIAGVIEDTASLGEKQAKAFASVRQNVAEVVSSNRAIASLTDDASRVTQTAFAAVESVSQGMGSVQEVLQQVFSATKGIVEIALQTRLIAFNAAVEANRAGDAGRSFGVVAHAVKELSEQVEQSSKLIMSTVQDLTQRVGVVSRSIKNDESASDSPTIDAAFRMVQERVTKIASSSQANVQLCNHVTDTVQQMSQELESTSRSLVQARDKVDDLLKLGESLIEATAESGFETQDTPFIEATLESAGRISAAFEDAVDAGAISLDDLFDEKYRRIPGTNPEQFMARFSEFVDRVLPSFQDELTRFSPKVIYVVTVDRKGYLPTHQAKFSKPQGKDPVWNAANCRNRRFFFSNRTEVSAAQNQRKFLLQTYRRNMGGGKFQLVKDLSVPIWIRGRHWGALRMGYQF